MFNALTKKTKERRGFTLIEVLVVVGIIAVIAAISVTGILKIRENLAFRQKNDYAKTIFMAAQTHLTELRASNGLEYLERVSNSQENNTANMKVLDNPDTAKPEYADYKFTSSTNDYRTTYDLVLPVGSVEALIREQNVIIEYNPNTGNVYSVFYSEDDTLVSTYLFRGLPRNAEGDEELRKDMMLGYYDGSDLSAAELGLMKIAADITFENGEEGVVTVIVPTKDANNFSIAEDGNYNRYMAGLSVRLTIADEMGHSFEINLTPDASCAFEHERSVQIGEGGANVIHITFPIDSLKDDMSFADLADGSDIRPGDNVSITAEVTYASSATDPIVEIQDAMVAGVNPMFHSLTPGNDGKYILTISNGRNLQNLNLLHSEIAKNVESVLFVQDTGETENIIDWNDTVAYYNEKYGTADTDGDDNVFTNATTEAPGRALPCFVPVMNRDLLTGTASDPAAQIIGNDVKIYDLNIDSTKYAVPGSSSISYAYTGLFATANTSIDGIYIVNPVIRGDVPEEGSTGDFATGALIGLMGTNASVTNCGVYVDTEDIDFVRSNLNMKNFTGVEKQYGVSGTGAVGGLIGWAQSTQMVKSSFAAIPVYGVNVSGNGAGGLVGLSSGTNYQKCYASGTVGASITSSTYGAGGFVGKSSNSQFENCFAAGDVNTGTGSVEGCAGFVGVLDGNSTLQHCYSAGLASLKEDFCGYFAGPEDPESKKKNYFLSQVQANNSDPNNAPNAVSSKLAVAVSYEQLSNLLVFTNDTNYNYEYTPVSPDFWGTTKNSQVQNYILNTHPYDMSLGNNAYPFTMLKDPSTGKLLDYYGNWPRKPLDVGIAYYEIYETNDEKYFGFNFDSEKTSTLRDDAAVLSDGYMILSATSNEDFGTLGISVIGNNNIETITIGTDKVYYVYPITSNTSGNSNNFYTELNVTTDSSSYTFYYNPNVALSHINPVDGSTTATNPGNTVPSTIYIRTARQLAAVGKNMSEFWDENYIQQLDIDFTMYQNGVSLIEAPIGNSSTAFTGSYIGRKDDGRIPTITGYKPADKPDSGIFGVIGDTGVVRNLIIESGSTAISGGSSETTTSIGLLAGQNRGVIEKVNLTLTADVTLNASATGTAGLLVGTNSGELINCQVESTGTATLYAAYAGGLVGHVSSKTVDEDTIIPGIVEDCSIKLHNLAGNETLAGVFGKIDAGVTISDMHLVLNGSSITSSGSAAGFVGVTSGTIDNCSVRGSGTIEGDSNAAGFAVTVSGGTIDGCVVSPAKGDKNYAGNSNSKLTISGASAAGFAAENSAAIRSCTALGTVTGTNAAGFVVTNSGTIEYCMSNVDMASGTVFAKTNSGTVKECYGWASEGAALDSAAQNAKTYIGSYFGTREKNNTLVLFDFDGVASNISTYTLAQPTALNKLTGGSGRSVWSKGMNNTDDEYPYNTELTEYPYPMLGEHYGDWPGISEIYAYGVVYYEEYSDEWGVHLIHMSEEYNEFYDPENPDTILDKPVVNAGYALFCPIGTTPFCNETNAMMDTTMMSPETYSGLYSELYDATGPDSGNYGLYKLIYTPPKNTDVSIPLIASDLKVRIENLNRTEHVELVPLFADTLDDTREPFRIRTQEQLENISILPDGEFEIDRCLSVSSFDTIDSFSGELTGIDGAKITATGMTSGLIHNATGAVIDGVDLDATITFSLAPESHVVVGTLVNTATDCQITACTVKTDITVNTAAAAVEAAEGEADSGTTVNKGSITIGGIVGNMQGGILSDIEITGSILTNKDQIATMYNCNVGGVIGIAAKDSTDEFGEYGEYDDVYSHVKVARYWFIQEEAVVGEFVGYVEGGEFRNCFTYDADTYPFLGEICSTTTAYTTPTHKSENGSDDHVKLGESQYGYAAITYPHTTLDNCICYTMNGDEITGANKQEIVPVTDFWNHNTILSYTRAQYPVSVTAVVDPMDYTVLNGLPLNQNTGYFILDSGIYYPVTMTKDESTYTFHYTDITGTEKTQIWTKVNDDSICTMLYTVTHNLDLTNGTMYMVFTTDDRYALQKDKTAVTVPGSELTPEKTQHMQLLWTANGSALVSSEKDTTVICHTYAENNGLVLKKSDDQIMTIYMEDSGNQSSFHLYRVTTNYEHVATSYDCQFNPISVAN